MKPLVALGASALALALAGVARAHGVGLSRGEYRLDGSTMTATLTFAAGELVQTVPELAGDRVGLTQEELDAAKGGIERDVVRRILVTGDGAPCPSQLGAVRLTAEDGVELAARFVCPAHPGVVDVDFAVVDFLMDGHRHLARASLDGAITEWVAVHASSSKRLPVGGATANGPAVGSGGNAGFGSFFRMGIAHILTGYDHLLFLAGLAIAPGHRRLRSLVLAITAFTVAHSITLALATLGVWGPSPRVVEPAIALSIAYVGVENCLATDFGKRWRVTLPFGLLHGFGFASALREVAMPRSEVPVALLSFNLGVETGQLAAVGLALPVLFLARKRGLLGARATKALSVGVGIAGAVWFVARICAP